MTEALKDAWSRLSYDTNEHGYTCAKWDGEFLPQQTCNVLDLKGHTIEFICDYRLSNSQKLLDMLRSMKQAFRGHFSVVTQRWEVDGVRELVIRLSYQ